MHAMPQSIALVGRPARAGRLAGRAARGFSLIEVLVAFVILSLVATALFRLFSSSLNNASVAEEYSRALLVAESQLEAAAAAQPLREGDEQGTGQCRPRALGVARRVLRHPDLDPELDRASEALAMRLFRISVAVKYQGGDGRERTLTLATVRMGPRNPA